MNIRDFADVDLKIQMLQDMEVAATKTAEAMAEYLSFDQDQTDEIKLALIEATLNAFEHSKSKDRFVEIKFEAGNDELTIKIHDSGGGFNSDDVEIDETESENTTIYELRLGDGDLGKVIGKRGKNIGAIRTLISAATAKEGGKRSIIEIIE